MRRQAANKVPWWVALIIVVLLLPAFSFPAMLARIDAADGGMRLLVWLYPVVTAAYAVLAWVTYPQRRSLSWILMAMMLLTTAAINSVVR